MNELNASGQNSPGSSVGGSLSPGDVSTRPRSNTWPLRFIITPGTAPGPTWSNSSSSSRLSHGIGSGALRHQQGGFRVPGWCYAGEAKRPEWQIAPRNGPPMWAPPQDVAVVRPLFEIRQLIVVERAAGLLDGLPTPNLERPS